MDIMAKDLVKMDKEDFKKITSIRLKYIILKMSRYVANQSDDIKEGLRVIQYATEVLSERLDDAETKLYFEKRKADAYAQISRAN